MVLGTLPYLSTLLWNNFEILGTKLFSCSLEAEEGNRQLIDPLQTCTLLPYVDYNTKLLLLSYSTGVKTFRQSESDWLVLKLKICFGRGVLFESIAARKAGEYSSILLWLTLEDFSVELFGKLEHEGFITTKLLTEPNTDF